jgi:hypothetical protein
MSGAFLSSSPGDRDLAGRLVRALRAVGADVSWDDDKGGAPLDRPIDDLDALIVLWTPTSSADNPIREQASSAQDRDKLINVLSGVRAAPYPLDHLGGLAIDEWDGRDSRGGFSRLVAMLEDQLVAVGAARQGELTEALARRDAAVQAAQVRVDTAEAEVQEAAAREALTSATATGAATAFAAADAQLKRLQEMDVTAAVLSAAQAEFDASHAANESADAERKAAAAALSAATRALTRARAELARLVEPAAAAPAPIAPPIQVEPPQPAPEPPPEPVLSLPMAEVAPAPVAEVPAPAPPVEPAPAPQPAEAVAESPPPAPSTRSSATPWIAGGAAMVATLSLIFLVAALGQRPAPAPINILHEPSVAPAPSGESSPSADTNTAPSKPIAGMVELEKANARAAIQQGDLAAAATWWKTAADQGDAEAEFQYGLATCLGHGVTENDVTAIYWFKKAADQGHVRAASWLGFEYDHGYGVPKDETQARAWYEKAAAGGDSDGLDWIRAHPL